MEKVVRPRPKKWTFYEMLVLTVVHTLLAVDEKYSTDISLDKCLTEVNREERHVTLEKSKQSFITEVCTNTKKTKISSRVETVKKAVLNQLLVMLDKIPPDGQIPTGRNVCDCTRRADSH